jgi:putative nucleotidyltransferase with HDIG domain
MLERDIYTENHQQRVAHLAVAIAMDLGLDAAMVHDIYLAASIHDLGKVSISAELLCKPRRLTPIEYRLVKQHTDTAYRILTSIEFPLHIATIVRQHHEYMDGTGYPLGLVGDQILIEARILTVADIVEAMSTHRPYRPAIGIDAALSEIASQRGITLDADVVDACIRVMHKDYTFYAE